MLTYLQGYWKGCPHNFCTNLQNVDSTFLTVEDKQVDIKDSIVLLKQMQLHKYNNLKLYIKTKQYITKFNVNRKYIS